MNLEKFPGPGSTPARRRFWNSVSDIVISSQKRSGHNVTASEYIGYGTLIDIDRNRRTATPCICPRDAIEISGFTMSGSVHYVNVGFGIDHFCDYTETWTRIDQSASFSAPHQFKLYTTEACEIVYEDNRTHDLFVECFDGTFTTHGSIVWDANLAGIINTPPQVTFGFFAEGDNILSDCVATYAPVVIPLDNCDLSNLLGDYTVSNHCGPDGDGGTWDVDGQISIF